VLGLKSLKSVVLAAKTSKLLNGQLAPLHALKVGVVHLSRKAWLVGRLRHVEADTNTDVTQVGYTEQRHVTRHRLTGERILETFRGRLRCTNSDLFIVQCPSFCSLSEQELDRIAGKGGRDLDRDSFVGLLTGAQCTLPRR